MELTEWVELTESWQYRWSKNSLHLTGKCANVLLQLCGVHCIVTWRKAHASVSRGLYHTLKSSWLFDPGLTQRSNPLEAITGVWLSTVWKVSIYHFEVCGGSWVPIADDPLAVDRQTDRQANWASEQLNSVASALSLVSVTIMSGEKQKKNMSSQIFSWAPFYYPFISVNVTWNCPLLVWFVFILCTVEELSQNQVVKVMPCHWFVNVLLIGQHSLTNEMPEFGRFLCHWAAVPSFDICFSRVV